MRAEIPLVSICIPHYQYAHLLKTTIDSALAQTYPNFEVIVSDNASTDGIRDVMASYAHDTRVRALYQPENIGIARNVNAAVEAARGEYVVVIGADDAMLPNYLELCMRRMLDTYDPVDLVYGGAIICNEDLRPVSVQRLINQIDMPYTHRNEFAVLLQITYILFTATLFKKSLFGEIGYLNAKTKIAFDWEFLLALAAADKRFGSIPEPVVAVRYHKNQASSASGYFFSGHAFDECLNIFEGMIVDEYAWRFRGYEERIIERLKWYDETFRDAVSIETLARYEAMLARLRAYAAAPAPARPAHVPTVSVVVLSDGDPGLLERALDALETQTYTDWEAVIVQYDGASLEGLVHRRNAPLKFRFSFGISSSSVARVQGIDLVRGSIIAHLHTDAVYLPQHLELAVGSLLASGAPIAISDCVDTFNQVTMLNYGPYRQARRVVSGIRDAASLQDRLHLSPIVDMSCVVHRCEVLDRSGSLVLDQEIVGEWEFVLRTALTSSLTIVPQATVELHHDLGKAKVRRNASFLAAIDETHARYPALDINAQARRREYRVAVEAALAEQGTHIETIDGLLALTTTLVGFLNVNAAALP